MKNYTVETYALIKHADKSLLKLNPLIRKVGYKFVLANLKELETKFSDLFLLPQSFSSQQEVLFDNHNVSGEFLSILMDNPLFGHQFLFEKDAVLIKKIKDFKQEIKIAENGNRFIEYGVSHEAHGELINFVDNLIQQLRLFKNGDITCPLKFQISKKDRKVQMRQGNKAIKSHGIHTFTIVDSEIKEIKKHLKHNIKTNSLTELALSNFNLSYDITDEKTKYITLMTALESLFNLGRDQITHTVSRHLSLIISKDVCEFQDNYKRIKELYGFRSQIVHGGKIKEKLSELNNELQDKVRKAINYCLQSTLTKEELFAKLNSYGWSGTQK